MIGVESRNENFVLQKLCSNPRISAAAIVIPLLDIPE